MLAQEGEIERFEAGGQPPVRLHLVKEGMAFLGDGVDAVCAGDESLRRGGPVDQLDHRVGELGGVSGLLAVHALPAGTSSAVCLAWSSMLTSAHRAESPTTSRSVRNTPGSTMLPQAA